MNIINEKITKNIPKLYTQDGLNTDSIVYLVLQSLNGWKWYITEYDGLDTFFGFVHGWADEWGYISKSELNSLIKRGDIVITSNKKKKLKEYIC